MVPTRSLLACSLLFTAAYATFRQKFHLPNLFKFRASYHIAAADVALHLDVIRTIGEHRPIQEQKLKQSAVSSPLGPCIIVPPLVLVVVNSNDTAPLFPYSHRRGGGFGFCGSEFGGEARPPSPLNAL